MQRNRQYKLLSETTRRICQSRNLPRTIHDEIVEAVGERVAEWMLEPGHALPIVPDEFEAFVAKCAGWVAADVVRKQFAKTRHPGKNNLVALDTDTDVPAASEGVADGPEEQASHRNVVTALGKYLRQLPNTEQDVLRKLFWDERTEEEVAESVGMSRGGVISTRKSALKALRQALRKDGHYFRDAWLPAIGFLLAVEDGIREEAAQRGAASGGDEAGSVSRHRVRRRLSAILAGAIVAGLILGVVGALAWMQADPTGPVGAEPTDPPPVPPIRTATTMPGSGVEAPRQGPVAVHETSAPSGPIDEGERPLVPERKPEPDRPPAPDRGVDSSVQIFVLGEDVAFPATASVIGGQELWCYRGYGGVYNGANQCVTSKAACEAGAQAARRGEDGFGPYHIDGVWPSYKNQCIQIGGRLGQPTEVTLRCDRVHVESHESSGMEDGPWRHEIQNAHARQCEYLWTTCSLNNQGDNPAIVRFEEDEGQDLFVPLRSPLGTSHATLELRRQGYIDGAGWDSLIRPRESLSALVGSAACPGESRLHDVYVSVVSSGNPTGLLRAQWSQ